MKITPREKRRHARSRFAHSTVPDEKWGTTRSLEKGAEIESDKFVNVKRFIEFKYGTFSIMHVFIFLLQVYKYNMACTFSYLHFYSP